jgi:anaerobic magnesium-protoporphyrin IX monomethyl ester cyclase
VNIVLVTPEVQFTFKALHINPPPLGLMYLAGYIKQQGHSVKILKTNSLKERDIFKFDVIGIGTDTSRFGRAIELARQAKKYGKYIIMGGYHPTFSDREIIKKGLVDCIVRGEGEIVLGNVMSALENGNSFSDIAAITYRKNGRIYINPGMGLVEDLDSLPYPLRENYSNNESNLTLKNKTAASMITSRGCPYDCYFCASSKFSGRKWRARSPKNVVDEMESIIKNKQGEAIAIVDDNFTMNSKRVISICDDIMKRDLKFQWWCMSRTDTIAQNPDMVRKMAKSGCITIFLGLESGDEEVLQNMNKKTTTAIAREAITQLNNNGIEAYGSFMIGNLKESEADIRRTIDFSKRLKLEFAQFSVLTPFPGTKLLNITEKEKKIIDKNWDHYDGLHSVIQLEDLTKKTVEKMLFKAYFFFYTQPRIIWKIIKNNIFQSIHVKFVFKTLPSLLISILKIGIKNSEKN